MSRDDFTTHEALSEIRERLARIEAFGEIERETLAEIRQEISALRIRVFTISAAISGIVGGGMSLL